MIPLPNTSTHWRYLDRGMEGKVLATASIFPPDDNEGWRAIATYPLSVAGSRDYQTAHSQAIAIRSGRRAYVRKSGLKFDARVVKSDHALVLMVRCLGEDGERWANAEQLAG